MGRPLSDEYLPIICHDMDPKYQSLVVTTILFVEENPIKRTWDSFELPFSSGQSIKHMIFKHRFYCLSTLEGGLGGGEGDE